MNLGHRLGHRPIPAMTRSAKFFARKGIRTPTAVRPLEPKSILDTRIIDMSSSCEGNKGSESAPKQQEAGHLVGHPTPRVATGLDSTDQGAGLLRELNEAMQAIESDAEVHEAVMSKALALCAWASNPNGFDITGWEDPGPKIDNLRERLRDLEDDDRRDLLAEFCPGCSRNRLDDCVCEPEEGERQP